MSVGSSEDVERSMREQGLLSPDVELILLPSWRVRDPRNLGTILQMRKEIAVRAPDVVHIIQGGGGDIWMAVAGLFMRSYPLVVTLMDAQAHPGDYPPPWVWRLTNALAIRVSDRIIVNGLGLVRQMQDNYNIAATKIDYTPMGPFEVFCRYSTGRYKERPNVLLFFGRILRYKGLEYLVRAQPLITRKFPDARIVIAGRGDDLDRCRSLMEDPTCFEVHDSFIPNEKVAQLFEEAAIVVMPYIEASTSGVAVTACAFGKPVVTTRVGCLPEIVRDGVTGRLVPPADVGQLADAIVQLLSDDVLRYRMGENAARRAKQELSWDKIAEQTMGIYEKTISLLGNS